MDEYLKWSKILKIGFWLGIALTIALAIYTIAIHDKTDILYIAFAAIFTGCCLYGSKYMINTYNENPDAEVDDMFQMTYQITQEEKRQDKEAKAQRKQARRKKDI
ncbi:MAG: hypothetical protein LKJ83_09840 [Eubacteriaceae bacterium]|jgi:hypothetical protein|nr:hypothetical protein [Eubacteriaceae bacterium]